MSIWQLAGTIVLGEQLYSWFKGLIISMASGSLSTTVVTSIWIKVELIAGL
jgi:hypothetical protein